jgi:hypothetical protein
MVKRMIILTFILSFTLTSCVQAVPIEPSPTPSSGIEGLVTEGPMCPGPVTIGDTQCQDQPYQATIVILDADNNEIIKFQTDVAGYFWIHLPPGTYTLQPESKKALPHAADQSVEVNSGQYTQVTIMYDTGMR